MTYLTIWKRPAGLACAIMLALGGSAQTYINKEWVETTGLPDAIDWSASAFDPSGNIIVVGNTLNAPGDPDVLVSKYDREGDLLWQQTYGGDADAQDYGAAVTTDASGNIFVAAAVTSLAGGMDIAVLKYDASGTLLWATLWNGAAGLSDAPSSLALDATGNIYVAGTTYSSPLNPDYALVKLGSGGTVIWSSSYDYAGFPDVATSITFDVLMDPVITGGSATAPNAWDYATVRYNKVTGAQNGVERVSVPGVGLDNALAFTRDNAGNLYVTGYREVSGNKDIQTVKLNSDFTLAWVMNFDGEGLEDMGKGIGADNAGNVYVTGHTRKTNGGSDFITIKYDANGGVVWQQRYKARNDTWTAEANKLAVTSDGGVIVVGTIFGGTSTNFMTVKYSAAGKLEWEKEHDGLNGDDKGLGLLVGSDGKVYVNGITGTGGSSTYSMVKYSTLKRDNGTVYDENGQPYCVDRELIVKFRPDVVNTDVVDNLGWEYGPLERIVGLPLAEQIVSKIGLSPNMAGRVNVYRIFHRLTTAHTHSTTRLGEQEPMYEHWSTFLMDIPNPVDLVIARDSLSTMPDVIEYAEPNHLRQLHSLPNDPLLSQQHSLVPDFGYPNADINCEPAWNVQTGQSYIRVGVLDYPIYWAHEDFGDGTYSGSKITGGWDFATNTHISNNTAPVNSHGTACAGIIGALSNNSTGGAGIAGGDVGGAGNTGVELISMGVFGSRGAVSAATIAGAIVEASTDFNGTYGYGCDVLNNSYGGPTYNQTESNAVRTSWRNKCVFVASRGNAGTDAIQYPVGYGGDSWVLSVGASGTDGAWKNPVNGDDWWSSSHGGNVDVVAPGTTEIVVAPGAASAPLSCGTFPPAYGCFNGTSAAAPHAAGVAALMMSEHHVNNGAPNNLACEDVEHLIQKTATDVVGAYSGGFNYPAGYDGRNGWGRVNAGAAVQAVERPQYTVFHSGTPNSTQQSTFAGQNVIIQNNAGGLANGWYNADRVQVIHTYVNVFSPTTQILDKWERPSSAMGYSAANSIDGSTWGNYSFSIVDNVASVVVITNCWHVNYSVGGSTINQWIPAPPGSLTTAYSLHLYDPTLVAVEEVAMADGVFLFPVPADDVLNVLLDLDGQGTVQLEVIDVAGRIVYSGRANAAAKGTVRIPVSNLNQGTYALRVLSGERSIVRRFIKR